MERGGAGGPQHRCQAGNGRSADEFRRRDTVAGLLFQPAQHQQRQQRMSAELDEIVVPADLLDAEDAAEQLCDLLFQDGDRRPVRSRHRLAQHIRQAIAAHLSYRRERQARHHQDAARHLVAGHGCQHGHAKCRRLRMTVRRLNDGSHDILAQPGMRNTENRSTLHSWLRQQPLLYLERRDLGATPVDDVGDPTFQVQIPILVEPAQIAGTKPTIDEGRRTGDRIVQVTRSHPGAAHRDFSQHARGNRAAFPVPNCHLIDRRLARRARLVGRQWHLPADRTGLTRRVHVDQSRPNPVTNGAGHRHRQRRSGAARNTRPPFAQGPRVRLKRANQLALHRRCPDIPGRRSALGPFDELR